MKAIQLALSSVVLLGFAVIGCGGGGGGGGRSPNVSSPQQTTINITVSPASANVLSGHTQQFTATVTGTSNVAVTWAASSGTISSAGLFTAPTVATSASVTVTATADADSSKSASASSIIVPSIAITSIVPSMIHCDTDFTCATWLVVVNGSGFAPGEVLHITGYPDTVLPNDISSTQLTEVLLVGTDRWQPGRKHISVSSADHSVTSNDMAFSFTGDQNTVAVDSSSGSIFQYEQGSYTIHGFNSAGMPAASFRGGRYGIAVDSTTGNVLLTNPAGFAALTSFDESGNLVHGGGVGDVNGGIGVAAKNGFACITQPSASPRALTCFDLSQFIPPSTSRLAGTEPWSLTMSDGCGETDVFAYDREGLQLFRYGVTASGGTVQMSSKGSTTFSTSEFTPASQLRASAPTAGGWYVVAFDAGSPKACMAAIMAPVLNSNGSISYKLAFVDGTTMGQIGNAIILPVGSFRVAADQATGTVVVARDDLVFTHFVKVASTNNPAPLPEYTSTTQKLAVGLAVTNTNIIACEQAQCDILSKQ